MQYRILLLWTLVFLPICALTACQDGSHLPLSGTGGPAVLNIAIQVATGKFQEFALPQKNSGLMRPALDAQGHLWFGEMSRNYLGSFDARRANFWQQTPPGGQWGIMGIAAAPDNTIWFTEQYADYIGHYFPASKSYRTYPVPAVNVPAPNKAGQTLHLPGAPNDIVLDQHGMLWFTEMNANAIGRLNPANGSLSQYALPGTRGQALDPYGIAVDPQGTIWFTQATSNRLGQLDPATGQVRYFTPPGIAASLMEVASDPQGQIWATTFAGGQLLRFSPTRARFTTYNAPAPHGELGGLYGLAIGHHGDIWVTVTAENLLARLDVHARRFSYYPIPTPNSLPLGLVEGPNQSVWFTEAGGDKIGELQF